MARSFSNAKLFSALVVDGLSKAITRRGYAASASQGVAASRGAARNVVNKSGEEIVAPNTDKVSWIPDPVTGYYRPGNRAEEIDVAELRAVLLKKH